MAGGAGPYASCVACQTGYTRDNTVTLRAVIDDAFKCATFFQHLESVILSSPYYHWNVNKDEQSIIVCSHRFHFLSFPF